MNLPALRGARLGFWKRARKRKGAVASCLSGPAAHQWDADRVSEPVVRLLRDPVPDEDLPPDAFGVEALAAGLAELLESVKPPFTVSLSGAWGIGKTTLTETVKTRSNLLVGVLDLWAQDVDQLRRSIVIEIGALLRGGGDAARDEVAKDLDKALHASATLSQPSPRLQLKDVWRRIHNDPGAAVWALAVLLLWILGFLLVSTFVKGLAAQVLGQLLTASAVFLLIQSGLFITIATTTESMAPAEGQVATLRKFREFSTITKHDERPVLMILDNLDRLTGEEAVKALGEIRSLVDVKGSRCLFLIPVDRAALARHLEGHLGDDEADAARDFLDKFFNLDVVLTRPASLDLRGWAREQAEIALPAIDDAERSVLAQIVASAAGGSPRLVKRMLNGVAARFTVLDEPARAGVSLAQVAFVEALVSRHPKLVEPLARNPQAFIDARAALATAVAMEKRTDAVDRYLARSDVAIPAHSRDELRDFLLQNEDVALVADQLQTILSLREDRVWRGVPNAMELKRALSTGEEDVFRAGRESLSADESDRAARASVDTVRSLRENRFDRDGLVAISAIAAEIAGSPYEAQLRRIGQELLLNSSPTVLNDAGIDLLFDGQRNQRSLAVKDALVEATTGAEPVQDPRALIRAVRNSAGLMSKADREALQKSLASYPDDDVSILFEDAGPHVVLLRGAVLDAYRIRLANWNPGDADQQPAITAAQRLLWLDEQETLQESMFDEIAARFSAGVSAAPADRLAILEPVVALVRRARTLSPGIDGLAQQLGQWSAEPGKGLLLAWRLPAQAAALASIAGPTQAWISGASLDDLEPFVREHRAMLSANGVEVASLLGNRFATTGEAPFAQIAVADDEPTSVVQFAGAIEAISDPDIYMQRTHELVAVFASPPRPDVLESLTNGLARRIAAMPAAGLSRAADLIAALAATGTSVKTSVTAIEARIGGAAPADVPGVSEAVERLLSANLAEAEELPEKVLARSGALGELYLPTAVMLGRRPGTSLPTLRQALLAAIANAGNTSTSLQPIIDGLRGKLRGDWRVTAAAVARATSLPAEDATALLRLVESWNVPPTGVPERAGYESQLTQIAPRQPSPRRFGGEAARVNALNEHLTRGRASDRTYKRTLRCRGGGHTLPSCLSARQ
jgi:hypothetical protein